MQTGKRKCVEEPLADKEKITQWLETIKTPIYNEQGQVIGTTGIARDITERKRIKEELERYRMHLEDAVNERTAELEQENKERRQAEAEREKLNQELFKSNKRLKQQVLLDTVTGLYNHRYLTEIIEVELYRAKRK